MSADLTPVRYLAVRIRPVALANHFAGCRGFGADERASRYIADCFPEGQAAVVQSSDGTYHLFTTDGDFVMANMSPAFVHFNDQTNLPLAPAAPWLEPMEKAASN
jgi:hypothetical protein